MNKKILKCASVLMLAAVCTAMIPGETNNIIKSVQTEAADSSNIYNYITTNYFLHDGMLFDNIISDIERDVIQIDDDTYIETESWTIDVIDDKSTDDTVIEDAIEVTVSLNVSDYKYSIQIKPTSVMYDYYREKYPDDVNMQIRFIKPFELKFNELIMTCSLNYNLNLFSKGNILNFTKRYENDENIVDYTQEAPVLNVIYTADDVVIFNANGDNNTQKLTLEYVDNDNIKDYGAYDKPLWPIHVFGCCTTNRLKTGFDEYLNKKNDNILYTKTFDTIAGYGTITIDDNQRCSVQEVVTQTNLEKLKNTATALDFQDGNYYQGVAVNSDIEKSTFGHVFPLLASIEKTTDETILLDDGHNNSFYNNDNIKYYYDVNLTPTTAKTFDFNLETIPYYKSGVISSTSMSLASISKLKTDTGVYVIEGFADSDKNTKKQIQNAIVDSDTIKKLFPDKILINTGDINEDGTVNIADALLLDKYLLGQDIDDVFNWRNADIDEDEILTVFDMVEMKQLVAKTVK